MGPETRYCVTPEGVRIAYKRWGTGPPIVFVVPMPGSIELEGELPAVRAFYQPLAAQFEIVRFDARGTGASQRDVVEIDANATARDLAGLADHLGLVQFSIFAGPGLAAHSAVIFSAGAPDRVDKLVLWEPVASIHPRRDETSMAYRTLLRNDWRATSRSLGQNFVADRPEEERRLMTRLYRETLTPDYVIGNWNIESDVSDALTQIQTPTLILHARQDKQFAISDARVAAALIPDARLVPIEARHAYFFAHHALIVPEVLAFLGGRPSLGSTPVAPFRTILVTDLVGHTEMMRRLGDDRGREVLREHERITRDLLKQHGGAEIKTLGDGFMASFATVTKAMDCAIALQRAFAAHDGEPLQARVGLNAGEPIEEDGDLFGSTVIMASRIAAKAGAGEILIPESLRHLLTGKSYVYVDRGETMLKGFEDAVRLCEVRWRN